MRVGRQLLLVASGVAQTFCFVSGVGVRRAGSRFALDRRKEGRQRRAGRQGAQGALLLLRGVRVGRQLLLVASGSVPSLIRYVMRQVRVVTVCVVPHCTDICCFSGVSVASSFVSWNLAWFSVVRCPTTIGSRQQSK